jgi:hypothetical protein
MGKNAHLVNQTYHEGDSVPLQLPPHLALGYLKLPRKSMGSTTELILTWITWTILKGYRRLIFRALPGRSPGEYKVIGIWIMDKIHISTSIFDHLSG